jgi:hypothetical protein
VAFVRVSKARATNPFTFSNTNKAKGDAHPQRVITSKQNIMEKQSKQFVIVESGYNSDGRFTDFRRWEQTFHTKDEACAYMHKVLAGISSYTSTTPEKAVLYDTFYSVKSI